MPDSCPQSNHADACLPLLAFAETARRPAPIPIPIPIVYLYSRGMTPRLRALIDVLTASAT